MKFLSFIILCIATNLHAAPALNKERIKDRCEGEEKFLKCEAATSSFSFEEECFFINIDHFANYTTLSADTAGDPQAHHKHALKYFPSLLRDSMGINFDRSKYRTLKPLAEDSILAPTQPAVLTKATNRNTSTLAKNVARRDTANQAGATLLPTLTNDTILASLAQRTTNLIQTYQVSSPDISIQLFDDGQIDGDAVSVYYNGKKVIDNQTLSHKALTFNIEASVTNRHHEFVLFADSEGMIAPNTALLRIKAGNQQFELNVSSSTARNAKIAIDYIGE